MMRMAGYSCILALAGCGFGGGDAPEVIVAADEVTPGLASCLSAIGRADVAADPDAPMSTAEIAGLIECTSERAAGS